MFCLLARSYSLLIYRLQQQLDRHVCSNKPFLHPVPCNTLFLTLYHQLWYYLSYIICLHIVFLYIPHRATAKINLHPKLYSNLFIYLDSGNRIFKSRFVSFDLYSMSQLKFRRIGRQVLVINVSFYQFCDFPILWIKVFPYSYPLLANTSSYILISKIHRLRHKYPIKIPTLSFHNIKSNITCFSLLDFSVPKTIKFNLRCYFPSHFSTGSSSK